MRGRAGEAERANPAGNVGWGVGYNVDWALTDARIAHAGGGVNGEARAVTDVDVLQLECAQLRACVRH